MNIAISVNNKYIESSKSMLYSLRKHVDGSVTVWFINHSVNKKKTEELSDYLKETCDMALKVIEIKASFFDNMPLVFEELFSVEVYYRILLPWLLPEEIDRVLWLDSDIIIHGDITEFYYMDLKGNCLAACEDGRQMDPRTANRDVQRLGICDTHTYFNSGVMLMNLELMRKKYQLNDIYAISGRLREKLIFPDQDILNYLYQGSTRYVDGFLYNCSGHMYETYEDKSSVKIIHYYGNRKPWDRIHGFDPNREYRKICRERDIRVWFPCSLYEIKFALKKIGWVCTSYYYVKGILHGRQSK